MTSEPTHTTSEMAPRTTIITCIHYTLLLAIFNPLCNILNQELLEKHLCNLRIPKEGNGTAPHLYQLLSEE